MVCEYDILYGKSVNLIFSFLGQVKPRNPNMVLPELSLKIQVILNFTAISLFMVLSSITGMGTQVAVAETPKPDQQDAVEKVSSKEVEMIMSTEQYVRKYR